MKVLILLALMCVPAFAEDVEVTPNNEYFISSAAEEDAMIAICAATLLMSGEVEAGAWFATIVVDATAINFFTNLFTVGLDTGKITQEEINLAVSGCIKVMNDHIARKAAETKS